MNNKKTHQINRIGNVMVKVFFCFRMRLLVQVRDFFCFVCFLCVSGSFFSLSYGLHFCSGSYQIYLSIHMYLFIYFAFFSIIFSNYNNKKSNKTKLGHFIVRFSTCMHAIAERSVLSRLFGAACVIHEILNNYI